MRVATWNINNVAKRLDLLLDWLARTRPDVLALQELKAEASEFPTSALREAGYNALVVGQRTWNGVALLSRNQDIVPVLSALPGDPKDKQARYLEAAVNGVLFACLYLPNGNPQPGPKFDYKLQWFERMSQRAAKLWATGEPVVLLGDWNVVPTDADIYKPDTWRDDALLQPVPRAAFARVLDQGWVDVIKSTHPDQVPFTFWDYRRKRWERNAGLRIDHILVGSRFKVRAAGVDMQERGREGASDHAPVWAELELAGRRARPKRAGTAATDAQDAPLARYNAKRDFRITTEPAGQVPKADKTPEALHFVVQKHWASRLHYDFRLELDGVMVSWAVPKGPSFDPAVKQMAIHVEDHPISYNTFEGTIPKGQYGAGTVIVWDRGTWEPVGDPRQGLDKGKLLFRLHGQKLAGLWELVRISKPGEKKQDQWILFKKRGDAWARPQADYDVITALPDSVVDKPLGLAEDREPHRSPASSAAGKRETEPDRIDLSQAVKAKLPATLKPQLATLVAAPPAGDWILENKFDGYRMLARIEAGKVRLITRNGNDWTTKLKSLATEVQGLGIDNAWLDGEIVVLSDQGVPDFNALQNAIDNARSDQVMAFFFDVPYLGEQDLRQVPLVSRRAVLRHLLKDCTSERVRFSEALPASPGELLQAACRMGLEGVILKKPDAPYVTARSESWLKLKCQLRQEFVVIGFTNRTGAASEVGGLLLGYHEDGQLRYGGSVGTGWSSATGRDLHQRLVRLETERPAVDPAAVKPGRWSKRAKGTERWVKPQLVVEVAFAEWTPDGHVRHPTFRGIREDKPSQAIGRERPVPAAGGAQSADKPLGVKVSNPERVIDPSTGLKKIDLVRYYESIAERMLPHLKARPVSLVRAPQGITGQLFFQKHPETRMPGLTELDTELWPGHDALMSVDSAQALVSAAQMNVVEFHTWNSTARDIDRPDRVIFDLDPGEGLAWPLLKEAAILTQALLNELQLKAWLKTSGGKGLHVVVPLARRLGYEAVKDFSQALVQHLARTIPSRFVAKSGPANRVGKVFVDYLRNGHGQTTAAAFSARSRPGLGVSMPISWESLRELKSGAQWTIATAREYLSFEREDPWSQYWSTRQTLTNAMKALGAVTKGR
jgi:bifunctional non-homologous end joining protein LigD